MTKTNPCIAELKEATVQYTQEDVVEILSTCSDLLRHPDYISKDHLNKLAITKGWSQEVVDAILLMCNQVNDYIYG